MLRRDGKRVNPFVKTFSAFRVEEQELLPACGVVVHPAGLGMEPLLLAAGHEHHGAMLTFPLRLAQMDSALCHAYKEYHGLLGHVKG